MLRYDLEQDSEHKCAYEFTIVFMVFSMVARAQLKSLTEPWFLGLVSGFLPSLLLWGIVTLGMGTPYAVNSVSVKPVY